MVVARRSTSVWLALAVVAGYLFLVGHLPPRVAMEKDWRSGCNWFGHPWWTVYPYAAGLLIVLTGLRYLILARSRRALDAVTCYALTLVAFLPAVWLLVVVDWDNEAAAEIACWVGYPVALLVVPTAFFVLDLLSGLPSPAPEYWIRTPVEIGLCVPVWCAFWAMVECVVLGWVGP